MVVNSIIHVHINAELNACRLMMNLAHFASFWFSMINQVSLAFVRFLMINFVSLPNFHI